LDQVLVGFVADVIPEEHDKPWYHHGVGGMFLDSCSTFHHAHENIENVSTGLHESGCTRLG
jgi:hypothetical protein